MVDGIETEPGEANDLESGLGPILVPSEQKEEEEKEEEKEDDSSRSQKPTSPHDEDVLIATPVFDIPWPLEKDKDTDLASSSTTNNEHDEDDETEQQRRQESSPASSPATCSICLDAIAAANRAEITLCRHSFCRSCLVEHCEMSLRQYPVPCPHQLNGCRTNRVPTQQLQDLLSKTRFDEHLKHYWVTKGSKNEAASSSSSVSDFFQCPVCQVLLQGGTSTDYKCGNCRATSCRVHGREHAEMTCEEFCSTDRARNWTETAQILETWTKPCSHCGMCLQKAAGCDHVVCLACQQDMCWRCGTHEYLTGTIIRHCGKCNRDYRDHRHDRSYRVRLCLMLPILFPFMVLYMVIATALCIVTGCFVCCFQCGKCLQPAMADIDGLDARRTKFGWTHGVGVTLFLLLLPLIALLEDCGLRLAVVDMLFPGLDGEETEIPILPAARADNGESAV